MWWLTDFSSTHIAHLLVELKFLILSMSSVGIRLRCHHVRKQAFIGALDFGTAFGGKLGQFESLASLLPKHLTEKDALGLRGQIILSLLSDRMLTFASEAKRMRFFRRPNVTLVDDTRITNFDMTFSSSIL